MPLHSGTTGSTITDKSRLTDPKGPGIIDNGDSLFPFLQNDAFSCLHLPDSVHINNTTSWPVRECLVSKKGRGFQFALEADSRIPASYKESCEITQRTTDVDTKANLSSKKCSKELAVSLLSVSAPARPEVYLFSAVVRTTDGYR